MSSETKNASPSSFFLPDDLRSALSHGTTLSTRFFLSLAALFVGAGYLLKATSWLSDPVFARILQFASLRTWAYAYLLVGLLGLWRVYSPRSRPKTAWAVNIATMMVWTAGLVVRLLLGPSSLLSLYSAITLMAFWCLLRTEATARDTRTA